MSQLNEGLEAGQGGLPEDIAEFIRNEDSLRVSGELDIGRSFREFADLPAFRGES